MKVPFLDLRALNKTIEKEIASAVKEAIGRADFILGKDEILFEKEFAAFCNKKYAVGLNSGTDALFLSVLSLGIGPGDEVIVPVFTYIATALAVTFSGARPVFVDISPDNYNIDLQKIRKAITKKTKAIIPVHLFGQSADMDPILGLAKEYNLKIIEDAAQAHGAEYLNSKGVWRKCGSMADTGCFSFYPTKNLGAFGDAGLVVTDNSSLYKKLCRLRDYGRKSRYEHLSIGYNSRLDTLQAAVLRVKLKYLNQWNNARQACAKKYTALLQQNKFIACPQEAGNAKHIYHAYTIRIKNRDKVQEYLKEKGVGTLIYYPIPLSRQKVYKNLGYRPGDFPVAEKVSREVLSLPMHPLLSNREINYVARQISAACRE